MKLRPYQSEMISQWYKIMARPATPGLSYKHVYLQAPTGVGKTEIIFGIIASKLPGGRSLFLTPRTALTDQTKTRAIARLGEQRFGIETVQGMHARVKRANTQFQCDNLFFDEVHLYATGEVKAIPTIIKALKPKTVTFVSATAWNLNEELIGARQDRLILYKFSDAYRDDILHPIEIVRYDTGTQLQIANKFRESDAVAILNMPPAEQARELSRIGVQASELNDVVRQRIRSLIDVWMSQDSSEPTLFFVPDTKFAEYALGQFTRHLARNGRDTGSVAQVNYKESQKITREKIRAFLAGEILVMIVCGMLREGFDYPALSRVYDCSYSPMNPRMTQQKFGRLTRKHAKKGVTRYVYAVDSRLIMSGGGKLIARGEDSLVRADALMLMALSDGVDHVRDVKATIAKVQTLDADGEAHELESQSAMVWDIERVSGAEKRQTVSVSKTILDMTGVGIRLVEEETALPPLNAQPSPVETLEPWFEDESCKIHIPVPLIDCAISAVDRDLKILTTKDEVLAYVHRREEQWLAEEPEFDYGLSSEFFNHEISDAWGDHPVRQRRLHVAWVAWGALLAHDTVTESVVSSLPAPLRFPWDQGPRRCRYIAKFFEYVSGGSKTYRAFMSAGIAYYAHSFLTKSAPPGYDNQFIRLASLRPHEWDRVYQMDSEFWDLRNSLGEGIRHARQAA
jgi:superfamily II DNA or RNA helicase